MRRTGNRKIHSCKAAEYRRGSKVCRTIELPIVRFKYIIPALILCIIATAVAGGYSFREEYDDIEKAAKSLFYVQVYDNKKEYIGNASGFVSFDEHFFVTNQHVIDGSSYIKIWDENDNSYVLDKVIVSDRKKDVAILLFPDGEQYESLELQENDDLKRGQPVVTIGSPEGYQNSVAFGNISALPVLDGNNYIQFTAPISHGSSGGCLFDDSGKVIGITSAGVEDGQNINFAIPIWEVINLYGSWNRSSYEKLGTSKSWDTVNMWTKPETTQQEIHTDNALTSEPKTTATPAPTIKADISSNDVRIRFINSKYPSNKPYKAKKDSKIPLTALFSISPANASDIRMDVNVYVDGVIVPFAPTLLELNEGIMGMQTLVLHMSGGTFEVVVKSMDGTEINASAWVKLYE